MPKKHSLSTTAASVALALLFLAACGKTEPNGAGAGNGDADMALELLDQGVEPRTALRYEFQANQTETMIGETSMAMSVEVGGQKQPETRLPVTRTTMRLDGKEVSPEGELRYEFLVEGMDVLSTPGVNPAIIGPMKQQMMGMYGLSGTATVTSRGAT